MTNPLILEVIILTSLTDSENSVSNLTIHSSDHLVLSDHFTLTFSLTSTLPSSRFKYVYDYPKAESVCVTMMGSVPISSTWTSLLAFYLKTLKKYGILSRTPSTKECPCLSPWSDYVAINIHNGTLQNSDTCPNVSALCAKKVSKNPTPYLCNKFAQESSKLSSKIQLAKSVYESKLVAGFGDNGNSKIYDYIRSL